jgi:hypothetical protein
MGWDELSIEQRHAHWRETERQMQTLMEALEGVLTEAEAELVREFTDHSEYGLALETVYDDLVEEPRTITDEAVQAIRQLASHMNLQSRNWSELEALRDL